MSQDIKIHVKVRPGRTQSACPDSDPAEVTEQLPLFMRMITGVSEHREVVYYGLNRYWTVKSGAILRIFWSRKALKRYLDGAKYRKAYKPRENTQIENPRMGVGPASGFCYSRPCAYWLDPGAVHSGIRSGYRFF
jgi:hypothetical protein